MKKKIYKRILKAKNYTIKKWALIYFVFKRSEYICKFYNNFYHFFSTTKNTYKTQCKKEFVSQH